MFKKVFLDHWIDWTIAIIVMVFIVVWGAIQQFSIEQDYSSLNEPVVSNSTKENVPSDWRTYVNLNYGYLIKYPSNFKLNINWFGGAGPWFEGVVLETTELGKGPYMNILQLNSSRDSEEKPLEDYVKNYMSRYAQKYSFSQTKINLIPAIKVSLPTSTDALPIIFLRKPGDSVYRIDYSANNPYAEQILATFHVLDSSEDGNILDIFNAADEYMASRQNNTDKFRHRYSFSLIKQIGDYALLDIVPQSIDLISNPDKLVMEKANGVWEGRAIGQSFPDWEQKVPELFNSRLIQKNQIIETGFSYDYITNQYGGPVSGGRVIKGLSGNKVDTSEKILASIPKSESITSYLLPISPLNGNIIFLATSEDFDNSAHIINKIYLANIQTGEVKEIYKEDSYKNSPMKDRGSPFARILRLEGTEGAKLLVRFDDPDNSPGPCTRSWYHYQAWFSYLDLTDTGAGLKSYTVPSYKVDAEKQDAEACLEENGGQGGP